MSIALSPDDLREITGFKQRHAQVRELEALGIRFGRRSDGSVLVLREHVAIKYGALSESQRRARQKPKWDAIS